MTIIFMVDGLIAQAKNKYGYPLSIVSDLEAYFTQIESDSNKALVEIKNRIPNIVLDIRYATENNFLKKVFYKLCSLTCCEGIAKGANGTQCARLGRENLRWLSPLCRDRSVL
jgi:hypothetical protein